jgi:toxin ParE1/3/4
MVRVIFRQEAINDLSDIWEYTLRKWSEKQADYYYETLRFSCSEIGKNPKIGRDYSGISKNLFGLKSGRHIIFYHKASDDKIEIIRILHERMDLKNRLP